MSENENSPPEFGGDVKEIKDIMLEVKTILHKRKWESRITIFIYFFSLITFFVFSYLQPTDGNLQKCFRLELSPFFDAMND